MTSNRKTALYGLNKMYLLMEKQVERVFNRLEANLVPSILYIIDFLLKPIRIGKFKTFKDSKFFNNL